MYYPVTLGFQTLINTHVHDVVVCRIVHWTTFIVYTDQLHTDEAFKCLEQRMKCWVISNKPFWKSENNKFLQPWYTILPVWFWDSFLHQGWKFLHNTWPGVHCSNTKQLHTSVYWGKQKQEAHRAYLNQTVTLSIMGLEVALCLSDTDAHATVLTEMNVQILPLIFKNDPDLGHMDIKVICKIPSIEVMHMCVKWDFQWGIYM